MSTQKKTHSLSHIENVSEMLLTCIQTKCQIMPTTIMKFLDLTIHGPGTMGEQQPYTNVSSTNHWMNAWYWIQDNFWWKLLAVGSLWATRNYERTQEQTDWLSVSLTNQWLNASILDRYSIHKTMAVRDCKLCAPCGGYEVDGMFPWLLSTPLTIWSLSTWWLWAQ